jgi:hypothetical protein
MIISRSIILIIIKFSETIYTENQHKHFIFNTSFLRKACLSWDNVETYGRVRQITAHTLCMLDNWGYRHALRIRNTYCFLSTSILVTLKRLCFRLYARACVCVCVWNCRPTEAHFPSHRRPRPSFRYLNQYGVDGGMVLTGKTLSARTKIFSIVNLCSP